MYDILKIIYNKSVKKSIINIFDIDKIIDLLIYEKRLNNYILNLSVQSIRSNNLASYSYDLKEITIYTQSIEIMLKNIENSILNVTKYELYLYINLCILQILLHEVEHAYQYKISYNKNSFEAFLIRFSNLIKKEKNQKMYECCPEERLAEIKSHNEILKNLHYIYNEEKILYSILKTEKLKRELTGYHYFNGNLNIPTFDYFCLGNMCNILELDIFSLSNHEQCSIDDRLKYGLNISIDEYKELLYTLVFSLKSNFKNKILVDNKKYI